MVNKGVFATERVDTQNVSLTNTTDSETYLQLLNVMPSMTSQLTRRQRTDSIIENLWDLRVTAIEGDIILTTPEIATWVAYMLQANNVPPTKTWQLSYTPMTGAAKTLTITGQVSLLHLIDSGIGVATYHFRIESTTSTVTIA